MGRGGAACAHPSPPPASHVGETKHGMMKFREDRSLLGLGLPSGGFHDRYFILNSSCLRLYKEVRVRDPWVLPRDGQPRSSVPPGLTGASPARGLGMALHWERALDPRTFMLWLWGVTPLWPGAPLGPGTWMPLYPGTRCVCVCLTCARSTASTRTWHMVTAPRRGPRMHCHYIGHAPRPTPTTCQASSRTGLRVLPSTSPTALA